MNHKSVGEVGERIAIGELAKFGVDVALPMGDNYPFDLILIYNGKLYKAQVKSSSSVSEDGNYIFFALKKNNWYNHTSKKYTREEIDVMILCDFKTIYLLGQDEFHDRSSFCICKKNKHGGRYDSNMSQKYIISQERLDKVLV